MIRPRVVPVVKAIGENTKKNKKKLASRKTTTKKPKVHDDALLIAHAQPQFGLQIATFAVATKHRHLEASIPQY
jgi:uncharacterized protein with gpF-like domain